MPSFKNLTDEDARQAASGLGPGTKIWQTVVETDRVPKTFINHTFIAHAMPNGGDELDWQSDYRTAEDPDRAESRDPHSGFIAYVLQRVAKGKELVTTAAREDILALYVMVRR